MGSTDVIGNACKHLNNCNGQGSCNLCSESCTCFQGFGSAEDIFDGSARTDCSSRICPSSRAWAMIPSSSVSAHEVRECSGA
eukprot:5927381-Ditylum_brightwellii.AAC.1